MSDNVRHRALKAPYFIIGHVTRDIVDGQSALGGTASYGSFAAHALGHDVRLLTSGDTTEITNHDWLDIQSVPSERTTTLETDWSSGVRIQRMVARASNISCSDIPKEWMSCQLWHLAPIVDEIEADVITAASPWAFVGITPQGWLRQVAQDNYVRASAWPDSDKVASRANAIVVSMEDLDDPLIRAQRWAQAGSVVAVTNGSRGSYVFYGRESAHVPAHHVEAVDDLGAGDVFSVAFFDQLAKGIAPISAAGFASVASALSLRNRGPYQPPSLEEIVHERSSTTAEFHQGRS